MMRHTHDHPHNNTRCLSDREAYSSYVLFDLFINLFHFIIISTAAQEFPKFGKEVFITS